MSDPIREFEALRLKVNALTRSVAEGAADVTALEAAVAALQGVDAIFNYAYVMRNLGPAGGSLVASGTAGTFVQVPQTVLNSIGSFGSVPADVNGAGEFVCPVTAVWQFIVTAVFPNVAAGGRGAGIMLNAAQPAVGSYVEIPTAASTARVTLSTAITLNRPAGTRIGVGVWQTSAAAMSPLYMLQASVIRRVS